MKRAVTSRRWHSGFIASALVMAMGVPSAAAFYDEPQAYGPARKLGRGGANIVSSPLEVPRHITRVYDRYGFFAATTWGVLEGVLSGVLRAGAGAIEVVTFPIPLFSAGYGPLIKPEFIWMIGDPLSTPQ
jgi:putative exosortase-associated protein (TIGR04073 family)